MTYILVQKSKKNLTKKIFFFECKNLTNKQNNCFQIIQVLNNFNKTKFEIL